MTECNAIIEANNEIDKLKRENKKLNALCVEYGFEMGRLKDENEQLYELIDFVNTLIAFKTSESCQKEWEKRLEELRE